MKFLKTSSFFWDCYARCYDGLRDTVPYQHLGNRAAACVPPDARTLLDAGCGTGNLLHAIRKSHPKIVLHGLDFSEAMLQRARSKVGDAVLRTGNLNCVLPYPTASLDVVTCINVLYAVAQPEYTVAELRRVLKPGGTLIVSSPCAQPRPMSFVRAHAGAAGWWRTLPLLARLSALVPFNAVIFRRGHAARYHFMDSLAAARLLACDQVSPAYAGLNWFACATKPNLPSPRNLSNRSTLLPFNVQ
jgi:ubiquinone/menaquinone biosynthesis C-methylase UbiE